MLPSPPQKLIITLFILILTSIFFTNDNAAARTIDVHLVANSGTADATNRIIKDLSIDGGDTYIMSAEKIVLSNGDTIQAKA